MKRNNLTLLRLLVFCCFSATTLTLPPLLLAASTSTQSPQLEEQTRVFLIKKMTCALCPITVSQAMKGVEGVTSVNIDFKAKTATVVFDPKRTNSQQIASASADAGYPAKALK